MKRNVLIGLSFVLALVLAACSGPAVEEIVPDVEEAVEQAVEEVAVEEPVAEEPAEEVAVEEEEEAAPAEVNGAYSIVPGESSASFTINEVLNGSDFTVVGTTSDVEGSIDIDYADTSTAAVNVVVDLSTLATDSNFRNGAIRERILQSEQDQYRYAEFTSTSVSGLPETITVGETYEFQVTGDLTIHGVTRSETFDVTATAVSDTAIQGSAVLTDVAYADYEVAILRLPQQVASVEDLVTLQIDFVANAG